MVALDKKIAKLPDGSEKRKLMYQKQQTEENNRKHKKSPIDEERNLHESYQILLRVSLWILIIMGVDWVYPKFGFQKCKGENLWFNFLSFLHVIFSNYLLFPHLFSCMIGYTQVYTQLVSKKDSTYIRHDIQKAKANCKHFIKVLINRYLCNDKFFFFE